MDNYRFRCEECGRFIGFNDKDAITYTYWGNSYDLTPPDARFMCGKCYEGLTEAEVKSLEQATWIKPGKFYQEAEVV